MAKKSSSSSKRESAPQSARANLRRLGIRLSLCAGVLAIVGVGVAAAYPMPPPPTPKATPSPSPLPTGNVLPFDSTLLFVLDDPISSRSSKAGQLVRAHLKDAIVVAGRTVAPAGTPAQIRIVDVSPSDIADTYGFVDIFFEPMTLPDGRALPLRAPVARLEPRVSSGHRVDRRRRRYGRRYLRSLLLAVADLPPRQELRAAARLRGAGPHRCYDRCAAQRLDRNRHAAAAAAKL